MHFTTAELLVQFASPFQKRQWSLLVRTTFLGPMHLRVFCVERNCDSATSMHSSVNIHSHSVQVMNPNKTAMYTIDPSSLSEIDQRNSRGTPSVLTFSMTTLKC